MSRLHTTRGLLGVEVVGVGEVAPGYLLMSPLASNQPPCTSLPVGAKQAALRSALSNAAGNAGPLEVMNDIERQRPISRS